MSNQTTTAPDQTTTTSAPTTDGGVPATTAPQAAAPPASNARRTFSFSREGILELQRGRVDEFLLVEFGNDVQTYDKARLDQLRHLTLGIIAMRRENVAAIGNDEMFVSRLPNGKTVARVKHNVRLSIGAKELFQIPKGRKGEDGKWTNSVAEPGVAQLTVPGYDALNRVVGCSVALPPTITIDGKERENPYIERFKDHGTTIGDVRRIVVCVVVAGMSEIGTPVVVRYTYEYEPGKELLHALGKLSTDWDYKNNRRKCDAIELVDGDGFQAFVESQKDKRGRWKYVPAFAGVGYACNLADSEVSKVFLDMLHVSIQAGRKAITVARRNAMRAHPALSRGAVAIDQNTGVGFVTVTGWTATPETMRDYTALMSDLAAGVRSNSSAGIKVIERSEVYEPEAEDTIDALDEDDLERIAAKKAEEEDDETQAMQAVMQQRVELMDAIREQAGKIKNPNVAAEMLDGIADLTVNELMFRLDAATTQAT